MGERNLRCLKGRLREVMVARDRQGLPQHELPCRSYSRAGNAVVPADGADRHMVDAIQISAWLRRLRHHVLDLHHLQGRGHGTRDQRLVVHEGVW